MIASVLGPERPTVENGKLKPGQTVIGGPYDDLKQATSRQTADEWYPRLFQKARERGIVLRDGGHYTPTLEDIADWTGHSVRTIKSWLHPPSRKSHRKMPRSAIRLVLWEFLAHDHCRSGHSLIENRDPTCDACKVAYDWRRLLWHCR